MRIRELRNPVMEYDWGSPTAIPELLGVANESGRPQAELWLGAHPRAPSQVHVKGRWIPLAAWIRERPREILGEAAAARFADELPFLLKVLAAAKPLSLQAHPSAAQAREGFARENARGIDLRAPNRSYRDPRAKPELLCALTRFEALLGFRPVHAILKSLRALECPELARPVAALAARPDAKGLREFFAAVLALPDDAVARILACAATADGDEFDGLRALVSRFPGDVGALAPLLLNRVTLAPGEAIFLGAGELHTYLGGVGVELMANSDNVLRGGLTSKHVDPAELLEILNFEPGAAVRLPPARRGRGEVVYTTPAREFELARCDVAPGRALAREAPRSVDLLLCVEGRVRAVADSGALDLGRGCSAIAPAAAGAYALEVPAGVDGEAVVYRAGVPPLP